jgi:hypothetical protein
MHNKCCSISGTENSLRWLWAAAVVGAAALCACSVAASKKSALQPSTVIKDVSSFEGKTVTVSGYLVSEFENRGVWDSRSKYEGGSGTTDCLSLLIPRDRFDVVASYSRRFAVVEGKIVDLRKTDFVLGSACSFVAIEVQDIRSAP